MNNDDIDRFLAAAEQKLQQFARPAQTQAQGLSLQQVVPIVRSELALMIQSLPIMSGAPGQDGKSVTVEDVRPLIEEEVAKLPKPKNGKDGRDGTLLRERVIRMPDYERLTDGTLSQIRLGTGDRLNIYGVSTDAQSLAVKKGTTTSPDTSVTGPLVKVERTVEIASASVNGDGGEQMAALLGIASGTAANQAQPVGVYGAAKSAATGTGANVGDCAGGYFVGRYTGTGNGSSIGAVFSARRDTVGAGTAGACGVEVSVQNYSGSANSYSSSGSTRVKAISVLCLGDADSGVGMVFNNPFGYQFDVGIGFNAQVAGGKTGAVANSSIRDDSHSTTSIDIRGSHTTAINVASGAGAVNLGDGTLTIGATAVTLGGNATWTRAGGTVAAGVVNLAAHNFSAAGDSGGTSNIRGDAIDMTVNGANAITAAASVRIGLTHAATNTVSNGFGVVGSITNSNTAALTSGSVYSSSFSLSSSGNVGTAAGFRASAPTLSSTGVITNNIGFVASDLGHATLVVNAIGHDCSNFTAASTLTAAYRSQMNSGTAKWGFYATGTADNAFAGNVRIGSVVAPTETLHVTGTLATSSLGAIGTTTSSTTNLNLAAGTTGVSSLRIPHGAAPSSPVDGDIWTTTSGLFVRINGVTVGPLT